MCHILELNRFVLCCLNGLKLCKNNSILCLNCCANCMWKYLFDNYLNTPYAEGYIRLMHYAIIISRRTIINLSTLSIVQSSSHSYCSLYYFFLIWGIWILIAALFFPSLSLFLQNNYKIRCTIANILKCTFYTIHFIGIVGIFCEGVPILIVCWFCQSGRKIYNEIPQKCNLLNYFLFCMYFQLVYQSQIASVCCRWISWAVRDLYSSQFINRFNLNI